MSIRSVEDVRIEEGGDRTTTRHPSDLLRMVVALVATVVGFLLATTLNEISEAITVEVIEGVDAAPNSLVVLIVLTVAVLGLLIPVLAIGYLAWQRQWRRLSLALLASILAIGLLALIETELVNRFSPPDLPFTPPSWVCEPGTLPDSVLSCVPGGSSGFTSLFYVTGGVAFFAALAPYLTPRWRRFAWIAIVVYAALRMITSLAPPVDEFLAIGIAYATGAAVLLVFGEPDRRPRRVDVVEALQRSGVNVASLKRAGVDARGSVPWFAVDRSGNRLFVKVLSPEERAADILFRVMRMFRLKGVGDERPFSSLKRGVEHEAVVALKASADGVRTPTIGPGCARGWG